MNRLGCWLLAFFVVVVGGFLLLSRCGWSPVRTDVGPAPAPQATASAPGKLVIPVAGVKPESLYDSFNEARGGGTRSHGAQDIMAPRGTPVLAAAAGKVEKIFESENGGHTVYIRSGDGGTVYYYAHLDSYADGLHEGRAIAQGEIIGTVGSTGDADPTAPHLHFEVKRMAPGEKWHQGTAVNPYPLLAG
ncbi:M23 family metallopeptidase [Sphingomonas sp. ID0503]|uniref:M23 family metallopeptidase n=1 Tax=Sphingomonas sp. ID0503 TaxID=3399691 RepID=UPI003AFAA297